MLKDAKEPCTKPKSCFSCAVRSGKPPQFGHYALTFKGAINDVDLILTPSLKVKDILSGYINNHIECVPHYVPAPKQSVASSGHSNFFLYAGTLDVHKGIFDLLEAFRKLPRQISAKLLIVGRGPLEPAITQFIQTHRLQDKVVLLGWVEKEFLWALYKDASALIVPSLNQDPCPTVIMEALSVGTPVIGSDSGGIPEMIRKVDPDLVFHAGGIDGLVEILSNYQKSRYPKEKVKALCQQYFSVEAYVSLYLKTIQNSLTDRKT